MAGGYTRKRIYQRGCKHVISAAVKRPDIKTIVELVKRECIYNAPYLNNITEEEIGFVNFVDLFCYFNIRGKSVRLKFAPINHESFCILS